MPREWAEFPLTKSRKQSSAILTLILTPLPSHSLSPSLSCLFLKQSISHPLCFLCACSSGRTFSSQWSIWFEVEGLSFLLLHVTIAKPVLCRLVMWLSVSASSWLEFTGGSGSTAWLTLMSNKSLNPREHQLSRKKYI